MSIHAAPEAPDPNLFRGEAINPRDLRDRILEIMKLDSYGDLPRVQLAASTVSMTELCDHSEHVQQEAVLKAIRNMMVGRDIHDLITNFATQVVLVQNQEKTELRSAALLRYGQYWKVDQFGVWTEPQVEILACGIPVDHRNRKLASNDLSVMTQRIIGIAETLAKTQYTLIGTYNTKPFLPTVNISTEWALSPSVEGISVEMGLKDLTRDLERVSQGTPQYGYGFEGGIAALGRTLQEFLQKHPNHEVALVLDQWKALKTASGIGVGVGGDEEWYKNAKAFCSVTAKIFRALQGGLNESFDHLFPETCSPEVKTTSAKSKGGIRVYAEDARKNPLGSATFLPSEKDDDPTISFAGYSSRSGVLSKMTASLLDEVSKSSWFQQELRKK